jgi:hypothetical protein
MSNPFIVKFRRIAVFAVCALALGGCVWIERPDEPVDHHMPQPVAPPEPLGHYFATPGHGAEVVAELRAAPAPQTPEIVDGGGLRVDERQLVAKSFVRIGTGCYPTADAQAHAWVRSTGADAGADKVLVYTLPADEKTGARLMAEMISACTMETEPVPAALVAVYYVRYKLPFGAQFRSLTGEEMKQFGGGVQIGAVISGTPASEANLRTGDFVLKFNGAPVRDRAEFQNLLRAHMGRRVNLTLSRDGTQVERMVRLGVLATESQETKR